MAIDRKIADAAAVALDDLLALYEHARRSAAGIVNAALVRLNHFHQQTDDTARRIELAALLAFRRGELAKEVFIDAAQNVLGAVLFVAQADGADEVNQFAQALLIQCRPGVVLGEHSL